MDVAKIFLYLNLAWLRTKFISLFLYLYDRTTWVLDLEKCLIGFVNFVCRSTNCSLKKNIILIPKFKHFNWVFLFLRLDCLNRSLIDHTDEKQSLAMIFVTLFKNNLRFYKNHNFSWCRIHFHYENFAFRHCEASVFYAPTFCLKDWLKILN